MNCNLFSRPMTRRRSNSHWEQRDMLWCVKTVHLYSKTADMNLTYAWKFKVATKNRKESKVSSDKQWTEHINASIHVEELWHSVHRNTCPCLQPEAATGSPTSVHENHVMRRSRPSSSSSASTWSAWLLLQKQTKGLKKKMWKKKTSWAAGPLRFYLKKVWK